MVCGLVFVSKFEKHILSLTPHACTTRPTRVSQRNFTSDIKTYSKLFVEGSSQHGRPIDNREFAKHNVVRHADVKSTKYRSTVTNPTPIVFLCRTFPWR